MLPNEECRSLRRLILGVSFLLLTLASWSAPALSANEETASSNRFEILPIIIDQREIGVPKEPNSPINIDVFEYANASRQPFASVFIARPYVLLKNGAKAPFLSINKIDELRATEHKRGTDIGRFFTLPVYVDAKVGINKPAAANWYVGGKPTALSTLKLVVQRTDGGPKVVGLIRYHSGKPVILVCKESGCDSNFETLVYESLSVDKKEIAAPNPNTSAPVKAEPPISKQVRIYTYDPATGQFNSGFVIGLSTSCDLKAGAVSKQVPSNGADFALPKGDGKSPYCLLIADNYAPTKYRCYRLPTTLAETAISIPLNDKILRQYDNCPEPVYSLQILEALTGSVKDRTSELRSIVQVFGQKSNAQAKISLSQADLRDTDIRIDSEDYGLVPNSASLSDQTLTIMVKRTSIDLDGIRFRFVDDVDRAEKYCEPQLVVPMQAVLPRSRVASSGEHKFKLVFDGGQLNYKVQSPIATQKVKLSIPVLEQQAARIEFDKDACVSARKSRLDIPVTELQSGEIKRIVSESKPIISLVTVPDVRIAKVANDADRSRIWSMVLSAFDAAVARDSSPSAWNSIQMSIAVGDGKFEQYHQRLPDDPPFSFTSFSDINGSLVVRSSMGEKRAYVPINDALFEKIGGQAGLSKRPKQIIVLVGNVLENSGICGELLRKETSRYRFLTEGPMSNLIIIDFSPAEPSIDSQVVPISNHTVELFTCPLPTRITAGSERAVAGTEVTDRISYYAINVRQTLQSPIIQKQIEQLLTTELRNTLSRMWKFEEARQ